jgi:hypothetical protein
MLKKVLIVSCIFLVIVDVSIFAEQPKKMGCFELIGYASQIHNVLWDIALIAGGSGLLAGGWFLEESTNSDSAEEVGYIFAEVLLVGGGFSCVLLGSLGLIFDLGRAAIKHAKETRVDISLRIQGPDLALANKFGGISLVCSY